MKNRGMQIRTKRFTWPLVAAIVCSVYVLGTQTVKTSLDYFLRQNAMFRIQDWARHISDNLSARNQILHVKVGDNDLKWHLIRESRHYNVVSFSLTTNTDERIRAFVPPPAPAETGPVQNSILAGLPGMLDSMAAPKGIHTITAALHNRHGKTIGHITATIDQNDLYNRLSASMYKMIVLAIAAVLLVIFIFWLAYRQTLADARRKITHLSGRDATTGLANRQGFARQFQELLEEARENCRQAVYLHIDLDKFIKKKTTHGYEAATEILRETARRLSAIAPDDAIICRMNGDEFAFAMPVRDRKHALRMGEKIQSALREPVFWNGRNIGSSASIGAAIYPHDGHTASLVEQRAAMVCWAVNSNGGNQIRFYEPGIEKRLYREHQMETLLEETVKSGGFEMHFQPLVNLSSGSLYGFEALIRMPGPNGGLVNPDEFISMAERMNLMDELGAFALREGCRIAADWPDHLRIAINLSPTQFESGNLVDLVRQTLKETGLPAHRLEAEVTENLMLDDSPFILEQLKALKEMGVNIVLDDFGTGYSSLNYLWQFPFDKLKIDRAFVTAMNTSSQARSILRAMLLMARALNIPVTAEGIETEEQAAWLRKLRCATGQGYLFGKPLPATELARIVLADWRHEKGLTSQANDEDTAGKRSA